MIKNISVQSYPEGIAFDPYNDYMYVDNCGSGTVSILSSTYDIQFYTVHFTENGLPSGTLWNITFSGTHCVSDKIIISIPLTPAEYTFTAATHTTGMSWDSSDNTFTVNDSSTNVTVYFTQNQFIGNITVQSHPEGIAFDPYNDYMYVPNCDSNNVSVIDQSNVVIKNISVQAHPCGIAFDPYNDYMYVPNCGNTTVSVIDQSNVVIKNISVQSHPIGIAFDPYNDYMYVDNYGNATVSVINQSNVVIKNISVKTSPAEIALDPYNDYMYVDNYGNASVSVINQSNVVIKNISVQNGPGGIAFDPHNNYMYVTNLGNASVSVIDQSNVVIKNISVQSNPFGIAFDPHNNYMYVINCLSGTVSILSSTHDIPFHTVEFNENGIQTGTSWNLTISGTHYTSDGNIISIPLTPSEYTYNAMSSNSSFFPVTGTFNVSSNMVVNILFQEKKYPVTFNETGLPTGTAWYVNLSNGMHSEAITETSFSFSLTNGTYNYTVATSNKIYEPSPASSSVKVNGASQNVSITFSELMYQVTFTESVLPSGTTWYLNLTNGQSFHSTTNTISFMEPNGSYHYTVSSMEGRAYSSTPSSGEFTISGYAYSSSVAFSEVKYQITFTESGLPSGTTWYIAVDNSSLYAASQSNNLIDLPNGTYYITAMSTGYSSSFTGNSTHIIITVNGSSMTVNLTFNKTSSVVTSKPSSSNDLFIAIAAAAGVIAGIAAGFFVFRKKN